MKLLELVNETVNSHYEFEFNLEELITVLYKQAVSGEYKSLCERIVDLIEFHLNTILQDTGEMVEESLKSFFAEVLKKEKKQEEDQEEQDEESSVIGFFTNLLQDVGYIGLKADDKTSIENEIKRIIKENDTHTNYDLPVDFSFNDDTEDEFSTPVLRKEANFRVPLQAFCWEIYKRYIAELIGKLRQVVQRTKEYSLDTTAQKNPKYEIKEMAAKENAKFKRLLRLWHSNLNPKKSRKQITSGFVQHKDLEFEKKILPELLGKVNSIST